MTVLEAAETIGGGTRSGELTVPGVLHDLCSAVHPMAAGSPFLRSLGAGATRPRVALARGRPRPPARRRQRRGDGPLARADRRRARRRRPRLAPPLRLASASEFEALNEDLRPAGRAPAASTRSGCSGFGIPALLRRRPCWPGASGPRRRGRCSAASPPTPSPARPADELGGRDGADLRLPRVRLAGARRAARRRSPTRSPPMLREHGGKIETGVRVRSLAELGDRRRRRLRPRPRRGRRDRRRAAAAAGRPRLPPLQARPGRLQGRPRGRGRGAVDRRRPAAGPAPSTSSAPSRSWSPPSATSTAAACRTRPFVLVGQQYLADPERSAGDVHPVWAYAHVPSGYDGDGESARARPDRALRPRPARAHRRHRRPPPARARGRQPELHRRRHHHRRQHPASRSSSAPASPSTRTRPAAPGLYICSAATPPGAGVHGMSGFNAAQSALRYLRRR